MSGDDDGVSLRVAKAIPSDVGHGRARISGDHGLDLKPGDIVEIVVKSVRLLQSTGEAALKMLRWTLFGLMELSERTQV